jgi:RNA polymerase sigma-70 factor, ECF subfamily
MLQLLALEASALAPLLPLLLLALPPPFDDPPLPEPLVAPLLPEPLPLVLPPLLEPPSSAAAPPVPEDPLGAADPLPEPLLDTAEPESAPPSSSVEPTGFVELCVQLAASSRATGRAREARWTGDMAGVGTPLGTRGSPICCGPADSKKCELSGRPSAPTLDRAMPRPPGTAESTTPRLRLVPVGEAPAEDAAGLVAAVLGRAPGAAGRMWDQHAPLVRRILRRMLGPVDVEDAVQDAFLRLFRDLASLREPSSLRSYLIGITLHVARRELRRRRARRWLRLSDDGGVADPEVGAPCEREESRAALRRLYQVLDRLSDERRMVFVLRYVEGLELAELSAVLDCSLATTKRRVADAARRVTLLASSDPLLAPYLEARP